MSDDHAALRAFASEGGIDWTEGEGITVTPGVCGGEPCLAGTRVTVAQVAGTFANVGMARSLELWGWLTEAEIRAAVLYREEHAALFAGEQWRELALADWHEGAEAYDALLAAVRALLAERDRLAALVGRQGAATWGYPDPASAEWDAEYDAAVQSRAWSTCDDMLDERARREAGADAPGCPAQGGGGERA